MESATWTKMHPLLGSLPSAGSVTAWSTAQPERGWNRLRTQLAEFRRYGQNWDGFGADSPAPEVIDIAIAFLDELRVRHPHDPPTVVALSPTATDISFSWYSERDYHRVEVLGGREIEWMRVQSGGEPEFWSEPLLTPARRYTVTWGIDWPTEEANIAGAAASR